MLAELGVEDHRQQARPGTGPCNRMERRRRLGDLLARPAAELLAHGLDHLPLARHHLQGLGDVLAQFGQLAAADRASAGRRDDDALARQMCREGCAHRPPTGERLNRSVALGDDRALARLGFQFLELQFELVQQLAAALGGLAILVAPQLGDDQLQVRDHSGGARGAGFSGGQFLALLQDQRVGLGKIGRQRRRRVHAGD